MASYPEWKSPSHGRLFLLHDEDLVDMSYGLPHTDMSHDTRVGGIDQQSKQRSGLPVLLRELCRVLLQVLGRQGTLPRHAVASHQEWDSPSHGRVFLFQEKDLVDVSDRLSYTGMPNDPRVGGDGRHSKQRSRMSILRRETCLVPLQVLGRRQPRPRRAMA